MRYSLDRPAETAGTSIVRIVLLSLVVLLTRVAPVAGQDLRPSLDEVESRWITIDRVELGAVDLDTSRVVVMAPDVYQIRTRWRFANEQRSPEGYRYQTSVAVRGVDCRNRQVALIAFADHDGPNVVRVEAQPVYAARWDRVNPQSVVDRIATHVCEQGSRHPATASASSGG